MPRSLEAATEIATKENPDIVNALYAEQAARFTVDQMTGKLLPQAQVEATYTDSFGAEGSDGEVYDKESSSSVVGTVTVPVYANGGEDYAQIRQAKHSHVAALQQIEAERTSVRSQVVQAWSQMKGYQAQSVSDKASITADLVALNGVRAEEHVGQRTVLDVLNAQQELLQAQVSLVTTRRNIVVASYTLVSAIGRLSASELDLSATVYDPEVHYQEVRNKWWGTDITHDDAREGRADTLPKR